MDQFKLLPLFWFQYIVFYLLSNLSLSQHVCPGFCFGKEEWMDLEKTGLLGGEEIEGEGGGERGKAGEGGVVWRGRIDKKVVEKRGGEGGGGEDGN